MGKKKTGVILIKLLSAANTGFFYTARKNTRLIAKKLAFRKYVRVPHRRTVLFCAVGYFVCFGQNQKKKKKKYESYNLI
jgi:ribosomal protein L33